MVLTTMEFATKWHNSARTERAASQEHFIDLCRMLGAETPNEADPAGDFYAFEKGAEKTGGGDGFADVWRKGRFAWEYKGKRKNIEAAYTQLLQYREALENPPLLVVCDLDRFEIHTNFTNTAKNVHRFSLKDLLEEPAEPLRVLNAVMFQPEDLRPGRTREELTADAAESFASLAEQLRGRGHQPQQVAHFLNKLLFCMFAEDAGLLPKRLIDRLTTVGAKDPNIFSAGLSDLFGKMSERPGGLFGAESIQWFNGGLFDGPEVLPLTGHEIGLVREVSRLDWSQVEPAIFGTLFERGLDPSKRSQLGAHYTDRGSIERLMEPVLMAPLRQEFEEMKQQVESLLAQRKRVTKRTPAERNPTAIFNGFLDRLRKMRVLDPACGSGNFLYVALQSLKDLEREAILWGSLTFQTAMQFPGVGPQAVLGLELNSYAAELARVVIWIGEIQWMLSNGFAYVRDPILRPLDNIQCRDAVLELGELGDPNEPTWPSADVIIGNPPFLGGKLMRRGLGGEYVQALFAVYKDRVPAEADLVTYWFEKARAAVEDGDVKRVGLIATQGIRGGKNRVVLQRIKATGDIFFARSDDVWVVEGAAVHVSLVGFDDGSQPARTLNGSSVPEIHPNLTSGVDTTVAKRLGSNLGIAFMGDTKGGAFDITADIAEFLLKSPNPDGRPNSDVVRPWANGRDVTQRPRNMWIIDFGVSMTADEAALYEAPFEYVAEHVKPERANNPRDAYRRQWWLHVEPRSGMRAALAGKPRFLATMRTAKHRLFVWLDPQTVPDSQLIVFAVDDDYSMGVLQSSVHEAWARATGTQLREAESGFRYTPTTCFEMFPFPDTRPTERELVSERARHLDELRRGWLLPASADAEEVEGRTLTSLYNHPPTWLRNAHRELDAAVHNAYGWTYPMSAEDVLRCLVELNAARQNPSAQQSPLTLIP